MIEHNDLHLVRSLLNLSQEYPLTYLSLGDLYTYELLILFIYSLMIAFSFFTNFIAIIIFFFGRRSRSELTPFLLNLSFFNIIMTVYCIPFTITSVIFQRWLYAPALCIVLDGFKTFAVSGVLLTLIAIAIDRYCEVKYPLRKKVYSARNRNLLAMSLIWLLSIILAIISLPARSSPVSQQRLWVSSRTLYEHYIEAVDMSNETSPESESILRHIQYRIVPTIQCVPNKIKRPVEVRRTVFNFLQTYFVPLFILAFVYLRIAAMLWRRTNETKLDSSQTTRKTIYTAENLQFKKKLKQGIKMLVAVVVLYAVLWLPMNVFQLCFNLLCYQPSTYQGICHQPTLLQLLYITAHFLTVSNTAINPIIYGFLNNCFRSDLHQLRRRLIHCQGRRASMFVQTRYTKKSPQDLLDIRPPFLKNNGQWINRSSSKPPAKFLIKYSSHHQLPRLTMTNPVLISDPPATKYRHTT